MTAKPDLDDYKTVPERIAEFRAKHPHGSLRPLNPERPYWVAELGGHTFIVYAAAAYRGEDDHLPGIGLAWEPFPGQTPYTRNSELMNAETSAWGRAIVAALAADTSKSIASKDEVRNRQAERDQPAAAPLRRPVDARTKERAKTTRTHAARAADGTPVDVSTGEVLGPGDLTDPEDKPGSIGPGQGRAIEAQLGMLGYDSKDRAGRRAEAAALLGLDELPTDPNHPEGDPRPSMKGLSMTQAADLIRRLQESLDAKRENERLAHA